MSPALPVAMAIRGRDDTGLHGEDQIILGGGEEDALALAQLQRGCLGIECREAGEEGAGRALCGWECWARELVCWRSRSLRVIACPIPVEGSMSPGVEITVCALHGVEL